MKNLVIIFIVIIFLTLGFIVFGQNFIREVSKPQVLPERTISPKISSSTLTDIPQATVIAENLDTPWAIAFLPSSDISMLVTERSGRVRLVENGLLRSEPVASLPQVKEIGEGGLLGVTVHPSFSVNHFIYLYYTYSSDGNNTLNRVVRMTYQDYKLGDEKIIVDRIPGAANHNGGRIKFGPDGYLYITTGDAQEPSRAQDRNSLAGKILRVMDDGKAAKGNSFRSQVYSYGHRNPQGIAWDRGDNLWATEHGRSLPSGFDELNLIEGGRNYGWPDIQGGEARSGMMTPKRNSGAITTWAPAGAAFVGSSLFFGGLRGVALYEAVIEGNGVREFKEHFKGEFGRIREVVKGPDGMLYITTSNKDGRGNPGNMDDRIIRINPQKL